MRVRWGFIRASDAVGLSRGIVTTSVSGHDRAASIAGDEAFIAQSGMSTLDLRHDETTVDCRDDGGPGGGRARIVRAPVGGFGYLANCDAGRLRRLRGVAARGRRDRLTVGGPGDLAR